MSNAKEVMALMRGGINCGQRYESTQHSRDPEQVYPILTAMYNKGFRVIRIPVTWRTGTQDLFELNSPVVDQITKVVDRALLLGFYVIINTHHEHWLDEKFDGGTYWNDKFRNLWLKIANHFKTRSFKLIFEVKNEPKGPAFGDYSSPDAPDPNLPRCIELTRKMNQVGYDAIRSVSASRIIMIAPNAMGNIESAPKVYPTADLLPGKGADKWLVITLHSYDNWSMCGEWGSDAYYNTRANPLESLRTDINAAFTRLMTWYNKILVGAPCLGLNIGEIGVGRVDSAKRNTDLVRHYYYFWGKRAREENISICIWDDMGYFNCSMMQNGVCTFPYGIVDAFLTYQR